MEYVTQFLLNKNVPYLFIQLSEFSFSVQGFGTGEFTEQLQMNQQTTVTKQLQVYVYILSFHIYIHWIFSPSFFKKPDSVHTATDKLIYDPTIFCQSK